MVGTDRSTELWRPPTGASCAGGGQRPNDEMLTTLGTYLLLVLAVY